MQLDQLNLNDILAFVRVVDAGGYAAAERKMGIPRSSLSRSVSRLEGLLALRLLQRTSRTFAMTDAGRALHERAAQSFSLLRDATEMATRSAEQPRGSVRLAVPPGVGVDLLPPILAEFVARYPEVSVILELALPTVDVVDAGIDLAIVPGPLRDSTLGRRKLQDMAFKLYAAPSYLQRAAPLRTIDDLSRQRCVLFAVKRNRARWKLQTGRAVVNVDVQGALASDDIGFVRRATVEGAGVALLPEIIGEHLVQARLLARVLPEVSSPGHPLLLVYSLSAPLTTRVECLRDHLVAGFDGALRMAALTR